MGPRAEPRDTPTLETQKKRSHKRRLQRQSARWEKSRGVQCPRSRGRKIISKRMCQLTLLNSAERAIKLRTVDFSGLKVKGDLACAYLSLTGVAGKKMHSEDREMVTIENSKSF